tara:strand:+ start:28410 stop:29297 length:888 start_codon:yes stop_codon:yes gene_type:complete
MIKKRFSKLRKNLKKVLNLLNKLKKDAYEIIFLLPFLQKPFPNNPFGEKAQSSRNNFLELHKIAINKKNKKVELFEREYESSINKVWFSELSLITQTCIKNSSLNFNHGRILYSLLSKYIKNNIKNEDLNLTILETGTARGFSSLCLSKAINDQNIKGKVITIDCLPHNKKMFWNCISDIDGKSTREELLIKWEKELNNIIFIQGWTIETLNKLGVNRINFAFLDAQHTKKSVLREFSFIYPRQKKNDVIFFDDVTPSLFQGVCDAVEEIKSNFPYKVRYLDFDEKRGYAIATRI